MERIPPNNYEAEKSALGAAMLSKDALLDVLEEVKADDFYNESHKEIFRAISALHENNMAVDMLTVCEELKKRKALEMVGGRAYIGELTADVPSTANAGEYAKIVAEKSMIRKLIDAASAISQRGYEDKDSAEDMLDAAEAEVFQIAKRRQKKDFARIQDVLDASLKKIEEASKHPGDIVGLTTGYAALDKVTAGLQKTDLIIVAARPSMGKTALALNMALRSAIAANASTIIFSLEMSQEQLGQRLIAMQSNTDSEKLRRGELEDSDWKRLAVAMGQLNETKLVIDDTRGISVTEMRNKCRRLKEEQGLDLIIVDYLQMMSIAGRTESRQQEISALSRQMKALAWEMDCPVVVLSQLSRGPELRTTDHHPMLSDLRESGSIEQDADIVMLLYRDEYYTKEQSEKPGICEINVAKNRNGATGTVELAWIKRYTKFSEITAMDTPDLEEEQ